jgi:hypothetical protein
MALTLDRLIARSHGSQLLSYTFESKELRFLIFHDAEEGIFEFHVPTDTVHGRTVSADPRRSTCRVELIDLQERLAVESGRYLAPGDTNTMLDQARDRIGMAYGRRTSQWRWLLLIKGEIPLLACLVRDLADIRWSHE